MFTGAPRREAPKKTTQAQTHRERMAARSRAQFASVAEIPTIPPPANPRRRARCLRNLHTWLVTYFPHSTGLKPFSTDHKRAIRRVQECLEKGGQYLQIVFRGWAKSTITENASLWAAASGRRRYIVPVGADANAAAATLEAIKTELEANDLLLADFPEICIPIRALEGKVQRCASQTYRGQSTHLAWTADAVVLPTIPGSAASAVILQPKGITANLRGMRYRRPDGEQIRPDAILLDDIQTDESARSPYQCETRLTTLNKSILRLGSHHRNRLAVICNATIIEADDLIDQLADHQRNPAWQTEKIPMLRSLPDRLDDLWLNEYADRRNAYNPDQVGAQLKAHAAATAYYRTHRKAMDAGARPSWKHCYDPETELSAIQHALNIYIDTGPTAFACECQCAPPQMQSDLPALKAAHLATKTANYPRGHVPANCDTLTAMIDVQGALLYWLVAGWDPKFSGYVVDYGSYPDQQLPYFNLATAKRTLARLHPDLTDEARIHAAVTDLVELLVAREWPREDGQTLRIARLGCDANWGGTSEIVNTALRHSVHAPVLTPTYGRGIRASAAPISQWEQSRGKPYGPEWVPTKSAKGKLRGVIFDANYWKKQTYDGLALPPGSRGAIVFHADGPHRMLADHLVAEIPHKVSSPLRTTWEWQTKPNQDNHLFDCLTGAKLCASLAGVRDPAAGHHKRRKQPRTRKARQLT